MKMNKNFSRIFALCAFAFFAFVLPPLAAQQIRMSGSDTGSDSSVTTRSGDISSGLSVDTSRMNSEMQISQINDITSKLTERTKIAISNNNYRVTAGDTYMLMFAMRTTPVTYEIVIDGTYKVRVANLGMVNAAGKTYIELKEQVEKIVSNNYPLGGASFTLMSPAIFNVQIKGEVNTTGVLDAWALSSLDEMLNEAFLLEKNIQLTDYASRRNVTIISEGGKERHYDLFKWNRDGIEGQNPYMRPGDTIVIGKYDRKVSISGAVRRPGDYELLKDENLKDLVDIYGGGFTHLAEKDDIELTRIIQSQNPLGDKVFLTEESYAGNYPLFDYDVVYIPSITDSVPVMFVEGAIQNPAGGVQNIAAPNVSRRLPVVIVEGDMYSSLIKRNKAWFSEVSDLHNAYIARGDERIPIDIYQMLYDPFYKNDLAIKSNDTLLVPFKQYFVSVTGAVIIPGKYPYIPDRTWDYYVALAGGIVKDMNTFEAIKIEDNTGKKLKKKDIITPESIITVKTNSFLYYFNRYAPIITTTLSAVATGLSVYATIQAYKNR